VGQLVTGKIFRNKELATLADPPVQIMLAVWDVEVKDAGHGIV